MGQQRKIKGLTMYEFNPLDMTLKPAEYKEVFPEFIPKSPKVGNEVEVMGVPFVTHYKLIPKEGCIYIQALNKKNAYKKIAKQIK